MLPFPALLKGYVPQSILLTRDQHALVLSSPAYNLTMYDAIHPSCLPQIHRRHLLQTYSEETEFTFEPQAECGIICD